jgi:HD-like signal output (HDOD) protein
MRLHHGIDGFICQGATWRTATRLGQASVCELCASLAEQGELEAQSRYGLHAQDFAVDARAVKTMAGHLASVRDSYERKQVSVARLATSASFYMKANGSLNGI